jgi:hypothetical protein
MEVTAKTPWSIKGILHLTPWYEDTFPSYWMEDIRLCSDTGASELSHYVDVQLRLVSCFSQLAFIYSLTLFVW